MSTLLVKNAAVIATMDDEGREIESGALFIKDHIIEQVGPTAQLPETADTVLDLQDHVVIPGLVNTHHHLYQTLTRVIAPNADLFTWLQTLYPIWANLTDEAIYVSTLVGLGELMLSGCTTSSDHLYIYPNDCTLDSQIRAAADIGMRFHAARGSMSLGESQGGLPPDRVTELEPAILKDSQRLIEQYHDASRHAMLRIVLAPCSPFSVTADLMRETAELARSYGVRLHTHLAETVEEETFCLETFGQRPVDYVASLGWTGGDVWHAHCVHMSPAEVQLFGQTGTGAAHCPSSNMRLASGIAPIRALRAAGAPVGLGVDGSASNDGSHMLAEARQAMLLQRIAPDRYGGAVLDDLDEQKLYPNLAGNAGAMTAREVLWLGTRGGAEVLGRDDIGQLAPGMSADFVAYDLNHLSYAGALHDPVAALLFCHPRQVDVSVIGGKVVVREGQLMSLDLEPVRRRHNQISRQMIRGE
jgi:cytosine/adenosine deaminase-related metal-dependent hydrolase